MLNTICRDDPERMKFSQITVSKNASAEKKRFLAILI